MALPVRDQLKYWSIASPCRGATSERSQAARRPQQCLEREIMGLKGLLAFGDHRVAKGTWLPRTGGLETKHTPEPLPTEGIYGLEPPKPGSGTFHSPQIGLNCPLWPSPSPKSDR